MTALTAVVNVAARCLSWLLDECWAGTEPDDLGDESCAPSRPATTPRREAEE